MNKVFLSHASQDKPFVRKVRDALRPYGKSIWLDEIEILPGDHLWNTIMDGISESDRALVFISEESVKSEWVQKEVKAFLDKEKSDPQIKIIPIILTRNAPPFLTERFHVRFDNQTFAQGLCTLLKGIFRTHSVLLIEPDHNIPFQLRQFWEALQEHKRVAKYGDLLVVYDHYSIWEQVLEELHLDLMDYQWARLKVSITKCMDLLTAVTPRLIQTILFYLQGDPAAAAVTEQIINAIWKLLVLHLFHHIEFHLNKAGKVSYPTSKTVNISRIVEKLHQLREVETQYLHPGFFAYFDMLAWLEHLNCQKGDYYICDFDGNKLEDGTEIYGAIIVPIREGDIRKDSLKYGIDVDPEVEFAPWTWINFILPYIVADTLLKSSYSELDVGDIIPKIGLRISDFCWFGLRY